MFATHVNPPQIISTPGSTIACYINAQSPVESQNTFISDDVLEWFPYSKRSFADLEYGFDSVQRMSYDSASKASGDSTQCRVLMMPNSQFHRKLRQ